MPGSLFGRLFISSGPLSYGGDMCHLHTAQSYLEVIQIKDICMKIVTGIIVNVKWHQIKKKDSKRSKENNSFSFFLPLVIIFLSLFFALSLYNLTLRDEVHSAHLFTLSFETRYGLVMYIKVQRFEIFFNLMFLHLKYIFCARPDKIPKLLKFTIVLWSICQCNVVSGSKKRLLNVSLFWQREEYRYFATQWTSACLWYNSHWFIHLWIFLWNVTQIFWLLLHLFEQHI